MSFSPLVLAIISQKGGSGKTTANWGLACALANRFPNKRVLFCDATPSQGSMSVAIAPKHEEKSRGLGKALNALFGVLIRDMPIEQQLDQLRDGLEQAVRYAREALVPVTVGLTDDDKPILLDFLPAAHAVLRTVVKYKWYEKSPGQIFGEFLSSLGDYDYIVFDTFPDTSHPITEAVLYKADAITVIQDVRIPINTAGFGELCGDLQKAGSKVIEVISNMYIPDYDPSGDALKLVQQVARAHNFTSDEVIRNDSKTFMNSTLVYIGEDGGIQSGLWVHGLHTGQSNTRYIRNATGLLNRVADRFIKYLEENNAR